MNQNGFVSLIIVIIVVVVVTGGVFGYLIYDASKDAQESRERTKRLIEGNGQNQNTNGVSELARELAQEVTEEMNDPTVQRSVDAANRNARDIRSIVSVQQLSTALDYYFEENKRYPDLLSKLVPNYISQLPENPAGGGFLYAACNNGANYELGAQLENPTHTSLATDVDSAVCDSTNYCIDPTYCVSK